MSPAKPSPTGRTENTIVKDINNDITTENPRLHTNLHEGCYMVYTNRDERILTQATLMESTKKPLFSAMLRCSIGHDCCTF